MRKRRRIIMGICLHCIVSATALGLLRVGQAGYNTTHREQVRMASLTLHEGSADIAVLGRSQTLPLPGEENMIWYAAVLLTDGWVRAWVCGISGFMEYL